MTIAILLLGLGLALVIAEVLFPSFGILSILATLAIVGAVHIAQHLAAFARDLGYAVTVIDPRRGFLTASRFPHVELNHDWPPITPLPANSPRREFSGPVGSSHARKSSP